MQRNWKILCSYFNRMLRNKCILVTILYNELNCLINIVYPYIILSNSKLTRKYKRYGVENMNVKNKRFLILSGVFFLLFLVVVLITSGNAGFLMDESVGYWADQNDSVLIHKLMEIASVIGSSEMILVITVIIGLVLLIRRSWRHFFFFFVVSVGGVALNLALKMLIQRARPGDETKF